MNKLLYRTVGRFYLGESAEQAQYVFQFREDAPKDLTRSFLIAMDKDSNFTGSALEVATEIKSIIDSYWINTDKSKIDAVVEYLETREDDDRFDGLVEERAKLLTRLAEVEKELSQYELEEPTP